MKFELINSAHVFFDKKREQWKFSISCSNGTRIRKMGATNTKRAATQAMIREAIDIIFKDEELISVPPLPALTQEEYEQADVEVVSMELTINRLSADFLSQIEKKNTRQNYAKAIRRFTGFCGELKRIKTFTVKDSFRYVAFLRDEGVSSGTIVNYLRPLNAMWVFCDRQMQVGKYPNDTISRNIWSDIKKFGLRRPRGRLDFLDQSQVNRVLQEAELMGILEHAVIATFILAGLRNFELRGLKWQDVDLLAPPFGALTVLGKGEKQRTIPMSRSLKKIIERYIAWRGQLKDLGRGEFFRIHRRPLGRGSVSRFWKTALEAAEIDHMPLHCARHTAATLWARSGVDLNTLRIWLGHSSLNMVTRYSHAMPDSANQIRRVDDYLES